MYARHCGGDSVFPATSVDQKQTFIVSRSGIGPVYESVGPPFTV